MVIDFVAFPFAVLPLARDSLPERPIPSQPSELHPQFISRAIHSYCRCPVSDEKKVQERVKRRLSRMVVASDGASDAGSRRGEVDSDSSQRPAAWCEIGLCLSAVLHETVCFLLLCVRFSFNQPAKM